jgi:hypothetical protein
LLNTLVGRSLSWPQRYLRFSALSPGLPLIPAAASTTLQLEINCNIAPVDGALLICARSIILFKVFLGV